MVKAIFFDIDGTLVSFETHQVPESTLAAIEILRNKGIKIFISTGRSYMHTSVVSNIIDFDGFITLNGSLCLTTDLQKIYANPIPRSNVDTFIKYQEQYGYFPIAFVGEKEMFTCNKNQEVEEIEKTLDVYFDLERPLTYALDKDIYQMVAFFKETDETNLLTNVLSDCEATRWNPLFADVIAKGNSKQAGIDKVLEYYGINLADTVSFGDGGNDISMLKHTPISFAMGNARDEVKKHATHVTTSVDDNGIWNALREMNII